MSARSAAITLRMTPELKRQVLAAAAKLGMRPGDWLIEAVELALVRGSTR